MPTIKKMPEGPGLYSGNVEVSLTGEQLDQLDQEALENAVLRAMHDQLDLTLAAGILVMKCRRMRDLYVGGRKAE